jgi:hypothetical protein
VKNIFRIIKPIAYIFCIFIGCFFSNASIAQNISSNKIGDFEFKVVDPMGWKASTEAILQAENILKYEGVKLAPSFAYSNNSGSLVFGTIKILRDGLAFSAQQLASNVPQFPEAWGVKSNEIQNTSGRTDYGLEFAVMRASGPGDGKVFGRGKPYKTIGVWIDIPVQYQDANGYRSVLISLFFRGFDSKKSSDENFLRLIMNSISPNPGASIITEKTYKAQFQPAKDEGGGVKKNEPQKVDSIPGGQTAVVADSPLGNAPGIIDPRLRNELLSLSPVLPNIVGCEGLKFIKEQGGNTSDFAFTVGKDNGPYNKCALKLLALLPLLTYVPKREPYEDAVNK